MNAKKLHYGLLILVGLAVIGSAFTVWYASNWLTERSSDLVEAKLEGFTLEEQQLQAFTAQKALNDYADLRSVVKEVAPKEKEQEKIIAELYKIAGENNISIQSLAFASSSLGTKEKAAPTPVPTEEGADAPESPAAPATPTPAKNTITQTEKIDGLTGVVGLQIQPGGIAEVADSTTGRLRANGLSYETILNFLDALERNRRQMIIDQISITPIPGPDSSVLGYTLNLSLTALIAT